jgi:Tfp pilus assembly protein PilF
LVYAKAGMFDEAVGRLQAAMGIGSNSPLVHLNLGKVFVEMEEADRAAEEFRRTISIDPDGPWGAEAKGELSRMGME